MKNDNVRLPHNPAKTGNRVGGREGPGPTAQINNYATILSRRIPDRRCHIKQPEKRVEEIGSRSYYHAQLTKFRDQSFRVRRIQPMPGKKITHVGYVDHGFLSGLNYPTMLTG